MRIARLNSENLEGRWMDGYDGYVRIGCSFQHTARLKFEYLLEQNTLKLNTLNFSILHKILGFENVLKIKM